MDNPYGNQPYSAVYLGREMSVHPTVVDTERPVGPERDTCESAMAIGNTVTIAVYPLNVLPE